MHELSLCQNVMRSIERASLEHRFNRVVRVRLRIGALAGVDVDALRFAFDIATRGSVADGAALEIERIPGVAHCAICRREVEIPDRLSACPSCGGYQLRVLRGDGMKIADLEVEGSDAS